MKVFIKYRLIIIFWLSLLGFAIDLSGQSPVNRKLYFQADGSMSRNIGNTSASITSLNKISANLLNSSSFITAQNGTQNSLSDVFTTSSGDDRILIVFAGILNDNNYSNPIDSIKFNGNNLVKEGYVIDSDYIVEIWILRSPDVITDGNIEAFWINKKLEAGFIIADFSNINLGTDFSNLSYTITPSLSSVSTNIESGIGDFILDLIARNDNSITPGVGQTEINAGGTNGVDISSSFKQGESDSTGMSWTAINGKSIHIVSNIKGKAKNASFTFKPSICDSLFIVDGQISINAHISKAGNIETGLPIKAIIRKNNGNIVASINRPKLQINGQDSSLIWTHNFIGDMALTAGDSINLEIFPDTTGISFDLDFGDIANETYLSIPVKAAGSNGLGIYDAAFGGGNAITTSTIGSTIYLRDTVRSVFGTYSLSNTPKTYEVRFADGSQQLTPTALSSTTHLKDSTNCVEIYEYGWTVASPSSASGDFYFISTMGEGEDSTVILKDSMIFSVCGIDSDLTVTETHPTCNDSNSGQLAFSVANSLGNYSWSLNDGGNTTTGSGTPITGLTSGTYSLTVTSSSGCNYSKTGITLNEGAPPIVNSKITNNCSDGNGQSGEIRIWINEATSSTTYDWDTIGGDNSFVLTGDGTRTISGLQNGRYTVTLGGGCVVKDTFEVLATPSISLSNTVVHETCPGNNGSIDLSVSGGSGGTFTYQWDNGKTVQDIYKLSGGDYTVTVTDSTGCNQTSTFSVNGISGLCDKSPIANYDLFSSLKGATLNESLSTNDSLFGQSVTYTLLGNTIAADTGSFSFTNTTTGAFTFTPSADFIGIVERDVKVCAGTACDTAKLYLDIYPSGYDTICYSDGIATFHVPFDPMVDSFKWVIPTGAVIVSQFDTTNTIDVDFSAVSPNSYFTVCVTTVNACGESAETCDSLFLSKPRMNIYAPDVCEGDNLQLSVDNGTSFNWTGPNSDSYYSKEPVIFNASSANAGKYKLTITDQLGCQNTDSIVVAVRAVPLLSINSTDATCSAPNGAIDITVTNATNPTYEWSNGAITEDISQIFGGAYSVTVTSDNGCTAEKTTSITESANPVLSLSVTQPNCYGDNATISTSLTGGSGSFTYEWSDLSTASTLTTPVAGSWNVKVTDDNIGCSVYGTAEVVVPDSLSVSGNIVNPLCNGNTDGSIYLSVHGGTSSYSYNWSGTNVVQTDQDQINKLGAGFYAVTVTDTQSCAVEKSYTLAEPNAISISNSSISDVSCNGGTDGGIDITVIGGYGNYSYQWVTGTTFTGTVIDSIEDIHSKAAGDYTVRITDANGCNLDQTFSIGAPTALSANIAEEASILCFGGNEGKLSVAAAGGTTAYSYLWSIGGNTDTLKNLTAGTYSVTVTDANGCEASDSKLVSEPALFAFSSATAVDASCSGNNEER